MLQPFSIRPNQLRIDSYDKLRSFKIEQFKDAFSRYLTFTPSQHGTTVQTNNSKTYGVPPYDFQEVTNEQGGTLKPLDDEPCTVVPLREPELGQHVLVNAKNGTKCLSR